MNLNSLKNAIKKVFGSETDEEKLEELANEIASSEEKSPEKAKSDFPGKSKVSQHSQPSYEELKAMNEYLAEHIKLSNQELIDLRKKSEERDALIAKESKIRREKEIKATLETAINRKIIEPANNEKIASWKKLLENDFENAKEALLSGNSSANAPKEENNSQNQAGKSNAQTMQELRERIANDINETYK